MSLQENKRLALRPHDEVFNQNRLEAADQIFSSDYVWLGPGLPPDLPRGPEGVKRFASVLRAAFPDLRLTIESTVAEGDQVVNRWIMHGTHKGEFLGVPASGKPVTVTGIDIFRIAGSKIVENVQEVDLVGMLQQIGAMPRQQPAGAAH